MIDDLKLHLKRDYQEMQRYIYIPEGFPYKMASTLLRQGIKCDILARLLRRNLPEFLEKLDKEAEIEYKEWMDNV